MKRVLIKLVPGIPVLIVLLLVLTAVGVLAYREADWTVFLWQRATIEERLPEGTWVVRTVYPWEWTTELMFYPTSERRRTCDEKAAYLKTLLAMPGASMPRIVDPDTVEVIFEQRTPPTQRPGPIFRTTWRLACGRHAPDDPASKGESSVTRGEPVEARGTTTEFASEGG